MSSPCLLKAEARTLSAVQVLGMSDDDVFTLFRRLRWGDGAEGVCPPVPHGAPALLPPGQHAGFGC